MTLFSDIRLKIYHSTFCGFENWMKYLSAMHGCKLQLQFRCDFLCCGLMWLLQLWSRCGCHESKNFYVAAAIVVADLNSKPWCHALNFFKSIKTEVLYYLFYTICLHCESVLIFLLILINNKCILGLKEICKLQST